MDRDHFARIFGYEDYDAMQENTTTVYKDGQICWNITSLPDNRFITWDNAEIADDRVEVFLTRESALNYLKQLRENILH
ncbi:hypothetical protein LPY66_19585 [Dehalobacter sp. DCM]|uniref:hypothetical protein n=1 Tax=Dehalobacter sp. DCM TaxID=2907827 RepID=UPI0030814402|nr:hypothetical protein LPY66_19585 [Dehalobacter sp. DCM]